MFTVTAASSADHFGAEKEPREKPRACLEQAKSYCSRMRWMSAVGGKRIAFYNFRLNHCSMRTPIIFACLSLALSGCERTPAISEADYEAFRASHPGMKNKCLDAVRYGGLSAWKPNDPGCFDLMPAQRWSGLWETGWEWTNFCPDPAPKCDWMERRGTWLKFADDASGVPKRLDEGTYRIEFIGRRTKVPGNFGHTASYDHLMIVDRVLRLSKLPGERYSPR